ncbi:cell division cycle protein 20 [Phytophthora cinnamomi]|uniref:cell division cycle protein 20 n=1 Tax=Phytophthora cinnamomi TaxID=4785 RepID=UPI00355A5416|nr:cell division cycle protein 20 [Phytophthora cinnamomi]
MASPRDVRASSSSLLVSPPPSRSLSRKRSHNAVESDAGKGSSSLKSGALGVSSAKKSRTDASSTASCSAASSKSASDRFIPTRSAMNLDLVQCNSPDTAAAIEAATNRNKSSPSRTGAASGAASSSAEDEEKQIYKKRLASALLGKEDDSNHKILKFTKAKPAVAPPDSFKSTLQARFSHNKVSAIPAAAAKKLNRHVPSAPIKVLDAPELMNDYYLNLLSWGANNILAVALGQCVYLWNAVSGEIDELMALEGDEYVSSVQWSDAAGGSAHLAIGTRSQVCSLLWSTTEKELLSSHGYSQNELCLWKYPSMTKVKELTGHTSRVLHLAASPDGETVVSGAADETLRFWKVFGPNRKARKAGSSTAELSSSSLSSVMSIR